MRKRETSIEFPVVIKQYWCWRVYAGGAVIELDTFVKMIAFWLNKLLPWTFPDVKDPGLSAMPWYLYIQPYSLCHQVSLCKKVTWCVWQFPYQLTPFRTSTLWVQRKSWILVWCSVYNTVCRWQTASSPVSVRRLVVTLLDSHPWGSPFELQTTHCSDMLLAVCISPSRQTREYFICLLAYKSLELTGIKLLVLNSNTVYCSIISANRIEITNFIQFHYRPN
jgi:hypothetical protein